MEEARKRNIIEEEAQKAAASKVENTEIQRRGDFRNFAISEATERNLKKKGIQYLFPIQYETFNHIYEGRDLIGRDRTGSGKTLAFALPILERLRQKEKRFSQRRGQKPYVLVLVPTRELAIQVTKEFDRFKNSDREFRELSIYGGTDIHAQMDALRSGIEVAVGTPGRVIDLLMRGALSTKKLKYFILDETDQMLNIGFQDDIERIMKRIGEEFAQENKSTEKIQNLLFSATIPRWVDKISSKFMKRNVVFVDMIKHSETHTSKTVSHYSLFFPSKDDKIHAIGDLILVYGGAHSRTIVFTDTKEEANEVMLKGQLKVDCQVLHGDIPQKQREVTFQSFRSGNLRCLVATNVAARGLDIPEVDLIVQLSPPKEIESYIHRSGRTGRAGKSGTCITFYTRKQAELVERIERSAKIKFKKIGAPQPTDIMKANARDATLSFDNVSADVLALFDDNVNEILERFTPKEAIARALAVISGYTKSVKQRSLLFSTEGYVTFLVETDAEVRSVSFFWNALRRHFAPNVVDSIRTLKMLANHKGVVFDLREEFKDAFEEAAEAMKAESIYVSQATMLPELEEKLEGAGSYGGGNYGGGSYGIGRGNFSSGYGVINSNGFQGGNSYPSMPMLSRPGFEANQRGGAFNRPGPAPSLGFAPVSAPVSAPTSGFTATHAPSQTFTNSKHAANGESKFTNSNHANNNGANAQPVAQPNNNANVNTNINVNSNAHTNNSSHAGSSLPSNKDDRKLFVSNLPNDVVEQDISDILTAKGLQAVDIALVRNPDATPKGFGYVRFSDAAAARQGHEEFGRSKIRGRNLRVDYADKKN